jgi:hypothetical protein
LASRALPSASTSAAVLWIVVTVGSGAVRSGRTDAVVDRIVMFRPAGQVATITVALVSAMVFATRSRHVDPYLGRLA